MHRRSGIAIMSRLIGLVKPLAAVMTAAIILGVAGYLCAIFLTILAGMGMLQVSGILTNFSLKTCFILLGVFAVLRGILHYGEQACNHFIAFKLLAIIRHNVFAALRRLSPAKLEGRDKGNLISIITSDIELLEVFYAHTISPIVIAILTSFIMVVFIGHYSLPAAVLALCGYFTVGLLLPVWNAKRGSQKGMNYRTTFGEMNSMVLDNLKGLSETIQYGMGDRMKQNMREKSAELGKQQEKLQWLERSSLAASNTAVLFFSFGMLLLTLYGYSRGNYGFEAVLIPTIAMMGSFGPVLALSSLSNNLNQTLASGERVLAILEEEPFVKDEAGHPSISFAGAGCEGICFSYEEEEILKDYNIALPEGEVIGIHGKSGSGKSTLLKLLMRFWDVQKGKVCISGRDVRQINTKDLRDLESYVTQETYIFHDSIASNIGIAKPDASRKEIIEAAKKASLHEFVESLPNGYDTPAGEQGSLLSGGERQRIGIARAFLHDAPFLLLDEPTSNLDSLNEGIILKSLKESCSAKTVVLVSHRKSTMNIADTVYEMNKSRLS